MKRINSYVFKYFELFLVLLIALSTLHVNHIQAVTEPIQLTHQFKSKQMQEQNQTILLQWTSTVIAEEKKTLDVSQDMQLIFSEGMETDSVIFQLVIKDTLKDVTLQEGSDYEITLQTEEDTETIHKVIIHFVDPSLKVSQLSLAYQTSVAAKQRRSYQSTIIVNHTECIASCTDVRKELTWENEEVQVKLTSNEELDDDVSMQCIAIDQPVVNDTELSRSGEAQVHAYYRVQLYQKDQRVAIQDTMSFQMIPKTTDKSFILYEQNVMPHTSNIAEKANETSQAFPLQYFPDDYQLITENNGEVNHDSAYHFGDFHEEYDLFYLLANYNVFSFDYYYGSHVVGPIIAGGEVSKVEPNSNQPNYNVSLALGGTTSQHAGVIYEHRVPSYIGGKANIVNTVTTSSYVPLFVNQQANASSTYTLVNKTIENGTVVDHNYYNYYMQADSYIDFDKAREILNTQARDLQNFEGVDTGGHYMKKVIVTKDDFEHCRSNDAYSFEVASTSNEGTTRNMGMRLKLGYNYVFEEGIYGNLEYIVYDYENFDEATKQTTLINVNDTGTMTTPNFFKSIKDELGSSEGVSADANRGIEAAYQFDSIEVEKALNIVNVLPYASKVQIGFNGTSVNSRKLVGHMVAVNATVDIRSGDYNGSIIADKVSSCAEGHMWPFKLDAEITLNKTVNHEQPDKDERFHFLLHNISKPEGAVEITDQETTNELNGSIYFSLTEFSLEGDYIFEVSELAASSDYLPNTQKFYVLVSVKPSSSNIGGQKLVPTIVGYYTKVIKNNKTYEVDVGSQVTSTPTFNNVRPLQVTKQWKNTDGILMDASEQPEIAFTLMQRGVEDQGFTVDYHIYAKCFGSSAAYQEVFSGRSNPIKEDTFKMEIISNNASIRFASAYSSDKKMLMELQESNATMTFSSINENKEVIIYVDVYGATTVDGVSSNDFTLTSSNMNQTIDPPSIVEREYTVGKLNKENAWCINFLDLPSSETIEGVSYQYTYYVKENEVPEGYQVSYEHNDGVTTGNIIITNTLLPVNLNLKKISYTKNTVLTNAEFELLDQNKQACTFVIVDDVYVFRANGNEKTLCSDKNGIIPISNLPVGDYILHETKAPEGFAIIEEYIYLHIDNDHTRSFYAFEEGMDAEKQSFQIQVDTNTNEYTYSFEVENIPDLIMPETGGVPWSGRYQEAGKILFVTGLFLLGCYWLINKRGKQKER